MSAWDPTFPEASAARNRLSCAAHGWLFIAAERRSPAPLLRLDRICGVAALVAALLAAAALHGLVHRPLVTEESLAE